MAKRLHIICGNCGSDEKLSYYTSDETVNITCGNCSSTTDLNLVIKKELPGFFKEPFEVVNDYSFNWQLKLTKSPQGRLNLVRAIMNITGFGLRESKEIADFDKGMSDGIVIKEGRREEVEEAAKLLNMAGATVLITNTVTGENYERGTGNLDQE